MAAPAFAADINAPLNDTPTIASEIRRGDTAAFHCHLDNLIEQLAFSDCISAAAKGDEQRHPNYAPFELGLYLKTFMLDPARIEEGRKVGTINNDDIAFITNDIAISYFEFRLNQKKLGLTDEQIVAALAAGDPASWLSLEQFREWERNPPKLNPPR